MRLNGVIRFNPRNEFSLLLLREREKNVRTLHTVYNGSLEIGMLL
jgi:hypothetical protein